jgi:hypothetical protein
MLAMNDKKPAKDEYARILELKRKRSEILRLSPQEALQRIVNDPDALELVHSFPEQDFYFLIHDIGPEDSVPVLSLASDRQWEYLTDLDTWQKDRIDINSVTQWMKWFLEADPKRFMGWLLNEKLAFIEYYLFRNIEVRIREHDQDPSDFGEDFFSLDGNYFVRFLESPVDTETMRLKDKQRKQFISELLERLAAHDHLTFQSILLEATHLIPAEAEEDCYKWRNVRLAEKGFLPFDEAIGIYQPTNPRKIETKIGENAMGDADEPLLAPVPQYPLGVLKEDNHFTRALTEIKTDHILQLIQGDFAHLCNQIIVADHKQIREREELRDIVKKACGYIGIGLERLSKDRQTAGPRHYASLLERHPIAQIFKVGFGAALELKWQAEKWLTQCWFAGAGLRLTFWGERWLGVLGGLLIKKPLFYDNYRTGVLYREFETIEDIRVTERIFNQIKSVDALLSMMNIHLDQPSAHGFLTYKNLILTLWARNQQGLSTKRLQPMTLKQFKPFFEKLFQDLPNAPTDKARRIPESMKNHFIHWLSNETGLKDYEITARLGLIFEELFSELEGEYGRVAPKDLDPRYINLFLLKPK